MDFFNSGKYKGFADSCEGCCTLSGENSQFSKGGSNLALPFTRNRHLSNIYQRDSIDGNKISPRKIFLWYCSLLKNYKEMEKTVVSPSKRENEGDYLTEFTPYDESDLIFKLEGISKIQRRASKVERMEEDLFKIENAVLDILEDFLPILVKIIREFYGDDKSEEENSNLSSFQLGRPKSSSNPIMRKRHTSLGLSIRTGRGGTGNIRKPVGNNVLLHSIWKQTFESSPQSRDISNLFNGIRNGEESNHSIILEKEIFLKNKSATREKKKLKLRKISINERIQRINNIKKEFEEIRWNQNNVIFKKFSIEDKIEKIYKEFYKLKLRSGKDL